jgi:hypothetical protein
MPRTFLGQNCFWIIAENNFEMSIRRMEGETYPERVIFNSPE